MVTNREVLLFTICSMAKLETGTTSIRAGVQRTGLSSLSRLSLRTDAELLGVVLKGRVGNPFSDIAEN